MNTRTLSAALALVLCVSLGTNALQYEMHKTEKRKDADARFQSEMKIREENYQELTKCYEDNRVLRAKYAKLLVENFSRASADAEAAREQARIAKQLADEEAERTKLAQLAAAEAEARRDRIRQQNAEEYQRRVAARSAELAAEAATAAGDQDSARRRAETAAEAYFHDYRPGGNSSALVTSVSVRITSVESVPGWSGRWRARGRVSLGYYVSGGGSFASEAHDFELTLDASGATSVELRS